MNLVSTVPTPFMLLCMIASLLILFGCESDPILAPQSETTEEGGSYGNTNLPVSGTGNAGSPAKGEQNSKNNNNFVRTANPKCF